MAIPFKYALGVYAKDKVTAFAGCITARSEHISGCNTYYLQPPVNDKNEVGKGQWFDEPVLEIDTTKQQLKVYEDTFQQPG